MTSPDGVHTVTYDPTTGQVTGLSAPGGVAQTFTYSGALPTSTTWSGPVVNGTVAVTYDQALRPYELTIAGQSLGQNAYRPDGMPEYLGPVTLGYRWDSGLLEAVSAGSASTMFTYDSLGQVLRSATVNMAGRVGHAVPSAHVGDLGTARQLVQDPDDLLFRESTLPHGPLRGRTIIITGSVFGGHVSPASGAETVAGVKGHSHVRTRSGVDGMADAQLGKRSDVVRTQCAGMPW